MKNTVPDTDIKYMDIKFRGIDDWNRPVYKVIDKAIYVGSVNTLFTNESKEEINSYFKNHLEELELFGSSFNCEPHGGRSDKWKFNIID